MAYNPNRPPSGPHRSTPLIARPSSNSHQNPVQPRPAAAGVPQGYLGNMMGGALAGMGYASPATGHYNNQYPSQQIPPYYPPPLQQQQQPHYQYQQQQNGYYAQQYPGYPPQQPFPSTSTSSSYPPANPAFSSLPSRPSHSALPPAPAHASSSTNTASNARAPKPPPRQSEFPCKLEGCKFVSRSRRTTREHEEDRHLMFEPGREPKPWSGSLKPVEGAIIEGTGISLDTPEAVAKWIADRKKRWPSKKVVEEKEKAREERIKAGLEEAPRVRGAGRGRGRGRGGMMDSSSGRGGGRGGYSSGSQVRERETETRTDEAEEPAKKKLKTEQDHSSAASSASDSSSGSGSDLDSEEEENDDGPEAIPAVSKEALKALLGDEAGEDEDDESDVDEDEPVEELSSKPAEGNSATPASDSAQPPTKRYQVVCRHWRKGNCALGDVECPYLHSIPNDQPLPPPRRNRPHPRQAPHNPFSRPFQDAFQLLEEQDLKHVVSDLLQVVDFLKANDWLRGVEIRAGQMDEESGIEVLDQKEEADKPEEEEELEEEKKMIIEEVEEQTTKEAPLENKPLTLSQPPPPSAPTTIQRPGGLGLVADYASSDEEDEEAEEQVKQALLLPASSS
ncbi:hypothetical protein JCM5350_005083 [Sporobolomyces pararoseus]